MKITPFDDLFPTRAGVGSGVVYVASGSNGSAGDTSSGGDVTGDPGDYAVVGLRRTVSLASNIGGSTVGDVLTIIGTSPRMAMFATPSNSGVSFGSNATRVSETASVGATSTAAREDHRHDGIGTITASSSNTLQRGTVNLRPGTNVSFGLTDTDGDGEFDTLTIGATAAGGGGGGSVATDTIWNAKGDLAVGTGSDTASRLAVGTNGYVLTADSGEATGVKWAAAGGSAEDPVASVFGTPDTAYEFDTSSLTGLTAIGSPTAENANTTVPGHLYYKDSTSSTAWMGRYLASPSTPFTAITKVSSQPVANYNGAGLIVGVADPTTGAFVTCAITHNALRKIIAEKFTNRTTYSSSPGSSADHPPSPAYLAMVVNSTTSIDYLYSFDGWLWRKFVSANNPSFTVGSVGVAMKSETSTGNAAAFDYLRIWNSAKTFPGA